MKIVTSMAEAMALGSDIKLYVDDPDSIAVNATTDWVRTDTNLIAAATDLGLSSAQLDDLFRLADTL
jgi:hypothetical protein